MDNQEKQEFISNMKQHLGDVAVDIAKLIPKSIPKEFQTTCELIMDQQVSFYAAQEFIDITDKAPLIEITAAVLERLVPLFEIQATQPMAGPVGITYSLRYTSSEPTAEGGRRLSLEILSNDTIAESRKFGTMAFDGYSGIDEIADGMATEIIRERLSRMAHFAELGDKFPSHVDPIIIDTSKEHHADNFICSINQAASDVARKTRRGYGNFVIVGEDVLNIISKANSFEWDDLARGFDHLTTDERPLKKAGIVNGITVYEYYGAGNKVVAGYKGSSGTDAGDFYCPYIMIMPTGTVHDKVSQQPVHTFMTRYGQVHDEKTQDYYASFVVDIQQAK